MASAGPSEEFQVFISHEKEDKKTIAIPLRNLLRAKGISAFVDETDIEPTQDAIVRMASVMEKVELAVIVLSPEFVAKKWPMRELLFFLERRKQDMTTGTAAFAILPVFYRLKVRELYKEPKLERQTADGASLYWKTRFFERRDSGEPEANPDIIRAALDDVHGIQGVENTYHASNHISAEPFRRQLLNAVVKTISPLVKKQASSKQESSTLASILGTVRSKLPLFGNSDAVESHAPPVETPSEVVNEDQQSFLPEALQSIKLDLVSLNQGRLRHRILTFEATQGREDVHFTSPSAKRP